MNKQILDEQAMIRTIRRISHEIIERNHGVNNVVILGVKTRGVYIAKQIQSFIEAFEGVSVPLGEIDISTYRDDKLEMNKENTSVINFDLQDKDIILVDDVLYTGRTVRAAMDAIMDFGRARTIQLAALVDRGHRELPIRPDYIGKNIPTSRDERVKVFLSPLDGRNSVEIIKE